MPPQLPVYQSAVSPPPTVTESVVDPLQREAGVAVAPVGVLGRELTVTVTLEHAALTHPVVVFRARAKYWVVLVGLTLRPLPEPTSVPPQLPVYQSMVCPPPTVADSDEGEPAQTVAGVAEGLVGVLGRAFTVSVTLAHAALTQPVVVFRARAKYCVVADGLTLRLVPDPISVPPQLPVYQSTVCPPPTVADSDEDEPLHIVEGVAVGLVGVLGSPFTVIVTVAHAALAQPVVVFLARA